MADETKVVSTLTKIKSRLLKYLLGTLALIVLLFAAYIWLALHWSYAEGDRSGYLQKFSKKGWLCKTWEGEISLISLPGTMQEKFSFTVRDEAVAQKVRDAIGKRVDLTYGQHRGLPTSCFGDTNYFVNDVKVIAP